MHGTVHSTMPETCDTPTSVSTLRRLLVRLVVAMALLACVDLAIARFLPTPDYASGARLPRALPTSRLTAAVEAVERASRAETPVVVFLGSSPTWGDATESQTNAVPASFQRAALKSGLALKAHNLGMNGALVSDMLVTSRRVADDADVLVVQLTYHTFGESSRDGAVRYPEIARLLGVRITREDALTFGLDRTPRFDITGATDRALRRVWRAYGEGDAIASTLFGRSVEQELRIRWEMLGAQGMTATAAEQPIDNTPFDELEPERQMLAVDRWNEFSAVDVNPQDSEFIALRRLASEHSAAKKRVVFYVSPLNVTALESFDAFDRSRYEAVTSALRDIVEREGHTFIDYNTPDRVLETRYFADLNHTTDEGSIEFGTRLFEDTREAVGGSW